MQVDVFCIESLPHVFIGSVLVVVLAQHHLDSQVREGDGVAAVWVVWCEAVADTVPSGQYVPATDSQVSWKGVIVKCLLFRSVPEHILSS